MSKVLIIGGGAAGMFASVFAARSGHEVHVYEKNEKLGKKLYITGKGRCNLTNACDREEFFSSVISNPKFLYSAFYGCTNQDVMQFFENAGLPLKTERGNRVFPVSDHSSDVIAALTREMKKAGVQIHLHTPVEALLLDHERCVGITLKDGTQIPGDQVIIATGGISYASTGSTGDGYRFAEAAGHRITELLPALVPFEIQEEDVKELQGLSLKNVTLTIFRGKKTIYQEFGEMLFTHFGVSGPLVLTGSSRIARYIKEAPLSMEIDLKPALSVEQLDQRLLRDFEQAKNKDFKNAVSGLFPSRLIPWMIARSEIPPEKKVNEISREERLRFLHLIKHLPMTITGFRDYNEAIITRGGVSVKEINPSTMESKKVSGLFFIGEVLDLDAVTGGFNLQIAWSTAYAAANAIITDKGESL